MCIAGDEQIIVEHNHFIFCSNFIEMRDILELSHCRFRSTTCQSSDNVFNFLKEINIFGKRQS